MRAAAAFLAGAVSAYVATRAAWIFLGWAGVAALAFLLAAVAYAELRRDDLLLTVGLATGVGASAVALSADDDWGPVELALAIVTGALGGALVALAAGIVFVAVKERRTSSHAMLAYAVLSAFARGTLGVAFLAFAFGFGDAGLIAAVISVAAAFASGRLAKRA